MSGFVDPAMLLSLAAAETTLEEMEREDLLAFALGQHRDKAEIADLSEWIHTAVAGKLGKPSAILKPGDYSESGGLPAPPEWIRPPMLTLLVPPGLVAQVHGDPKDRDCLLLVHIKHEVLDSWLAQKELSQGVQ